jgi:menaquinone-dependent protoporphyrinogen oxidase
MRILIVTASRHGSTSGIAAVIQSELRARGFAVDSVQPAAAPAPSDYDGVVLGSAVYMGNWLAGARTYVENHRDSLNSLPVWMFSSGPLGEETLAPEDDPERLREALNLTNVREHRIFAGRLDRAELGFGERIITRAVKAPEGDFRDWSAIADWARDIGSQLRDGQNP